MPSARELAGLLADQDRRRVFAAVALGARTLEQVVAATGLPAKVAGRALSRLHAGGLLDGDLAKDLSVRDETLREAARPAPMPEEDLPGADPESADVLRRFLSGGRLTAIPAGRDKRRTVLDYLASRFEPGRRYDEPEVNELLAAWYDDHVSLRRHLVDEDLLDRVAVTLPSGRVTHVYWRVGGSFDPDGTEQES